MMEAAALAVQHEHLVIVVDVLGIPTGRQLRREHAVGRPDGKARRYQASPDRDAMMMAVHR